MENTSSGELARELLNYCLEEREWPGSLLEELLRQALVSPRASRDFFQIVVERLGDLFEPRLCKTYALLFSQIIARIRPELAAEDLLARYGRVRRPRKAAGDPQNIFVLSRVTLGADVAVTSVILNALERRFPHAQIHFAGPRKNWALFAANSRIRHAPLDYGRGGTIQERLGVWPRLRALVDQPGSIVVDPDSRLTQLGLLPVCPEESYFFFESRAYGAGTDESLSNLASLWASETFGVDESRAWIAPESAALSPGATVSFGVGENREKRVSDPFEVNLLKALVERTGSILIDKGAGGEETARVEKAIHEAGSVAAWEGDYAPFAAAISRSRLYIGYDSAGQHVAAACGVPLVSVFAGYVSDRMFQRWKPTGPGAIEIVRVTDSNPEAVLRQTLCAVDRLRASRKLG